MIAEHGKPVSFRRHGVPDVHVTLGPPAALYAHYELDAAGVAARARDLLQHTGSRHTGSQDTKGNGR